MSDAADSTHAVAEPDRAPAMDAASMTGEGARPALWERVLLPAHPPSNLAVLRIILGTYFVYFLTIQRANFIEVATTSDPEVFDPVGITAWFSQPIPNGLYVVIYTACQVTSVLFLLGFLFRLAGPLFGCLMLFVLTYRQDFGFIYHTDNLMALHAMVLGFAPSAHAFSMDRWFSQQTPGTQLADRAVAVRRWLSFGMARGPDTAEASFRYGWPAQAILLLTGITYWVAGMAKIGRSNVSFDWVAQGHLFAHIGNNALRYEFLHKGALPITDFVFSWPPWVIVVLSAGSLFLELTAPLLVVPGPVRYMMALGLYSFHWGIKMVMGIPFHYQLRGFAFAPVVRWDVVLERVRALMARRPSS